MIQTYQFIIKEGEALTSEFNISRNVYLKKCWAVPKVEKKVDKL